MPPRTHTLPLGILLLMNCVEISHAATTFTLRPDNSGTANGDAFVTTGPTGNLANNNYGAAGGLAIAGSAAKRGGETGQHKGEFASVIRMNLAPIKTAFDTTFGAGQWIVSSVKLELTSSPGANNAIFNDDIGGPFAISWLENDNWVEGNGTPNAPSATGVKWTDLPALSAVQEPLGSFVFPPTVPLTSQFTLTPSAGLLADLMSGSAASFLIAPASDATSMVFNSRNFGTSSSRPALIVTAIKAPAVTQEATQITATSALLRGTANAGGDSLELTFEYGLTDAYGSSVTATPDTVTGDADTPVTAALSGLDTGVTYHYRLKGVKGMEVFYGQDRTFTTGLPQIVVELPPGNALTSGTAEADFGDVVTGGEQPLLLTLRNAGQVPLTLNGTAITGADETSFESENPGLSPLPPGGETTQQLKFQPTRVGTHEALLTLSSNDPDEPEFEIILRGFGTRSQAGDTAAPRVILQSPTANAQLNVPVGETITLTGNATDNLGVRDVEVSINNGPFIKATLNDPGAADTAWSATLEPPGGPVTARVRAVDFAARTSTEVTRAFTVRRNLNVEIVGTGSVTRGFAPSSFREVDRPVTITAAPARPRRINAGTPGSMFAGWELTDSLVPPRSTAELLNAAGLPAQALLAARLRLIFREGIGLRARFVPNPYVPGAGRYRGLVTTSSSAPNVTTEGALEATVSVLGAFSARLTLDGAVHRLTGFFDADGKARFGALLDDFRILSRSGKPSLRISLNLQEIASGGGSSWEIIGTVAVLDGGDIPVDLSHLLALRSAYDGKTAATTVPDVYLTVRGTEPPPKGRGTGLFTVILPVDESAPPPANPFARGIGTGLLRIAKNGGVTFAGQLSEGTRLTLSSLLSADLRAGLFARLHSNRGFFSTWIELDHLLADTDVASPIDAPALWSRPALPNHHYYPDGWPEGLYLRWLGAKYNPAGSVVKKTGGLDLNPPDPVDGNARLIFSAGGLQSPVEERVNITDANRVNKLPAAQTEVFNLSIIPGKAAVSGGFTPPGGSRTQFTGVLYQKGEHAGAHGRFLTPKPRRADGTGLSGEARLIAVP